MKLLRDADSKGHLEIARKWAVIDLGIVEKDLGMLSTAEEKWWHLGMYYPSLFIFVLNQLNQNDRLN